jgi:hypothetical protein
VQKTVDGQAQSRSSTGQVLDDQTVKRSGDIVCSLYHAQGDEEHRFLCLASKLRSTVSPGSASKPIVAGFSVWASKPVAMV